MKIIIIGACSTIAIATARRLINHETVFYLVARNAQKLAEVENDLYARGAKSIRTFLMDTNDIDAHEAMLKDCQSDGLQIDHMLVAHGTLPDQEKCELDVALTVQELTTNAVSTVALLTRFALLLSEQRYGTLCVITSVAGNRGRPSNYVYGAAKGMVSTFIEGMTAKLSKVGISVLDVQPGFVKSEMTKHLNLPNILTSEPDTIGTSIAHAITAKKRGVIYTPRYWGLIMLVIKLIPTRIFNRLSL
jgi:short-subunit dehydrogenase